MFTELREKTVFKQTQQYAFDYIDSITERNVYPSDEALEQLNYFDEPLPENYSNAIDVLESLNQYGSPATVAQTGGRYFGFVNGGALPISLASRWLADNWDQNAALYLTSPIAAKLEEVCERWLRALFGLPESVVTGFVTGSTLATFCGLAAARYRLLSNNGWDINHYGMNGAPALRVVTSKHIHATVIKSLSLLGFGINNIEWVDSDDQGRITLEKIPQLDERTLLILQAGNVCTGSYDAIDSICIEALKANAWVHIDGAFGLWAACSKPLSYLTTGIEKANSFFVDAHKTLNTLYDCGLALCNDKEAFAHALHASGDYITYSEQRDGMLYSPEMSRRSRAIDLWATLKYLGRSGVGELVYGLHSRATQAALALKEEDFRIVNDVVFNQVLIACEDDSVTQSTLEKIQKSGECWMGPAIWNGRKVIRLSVCSWATTESDIERTVQAMVQARADSI